MGVNMITAWLNPSALVKRVAALVLTFVTAQTLPETDRDLSGLEAIRERGVLLCGVDAGLAGFASEVDGEWVGFEADLCRAYAAAFLGNRDRVRFVPLTTTERFDALRAGDVDMLLRNTSWTLARDAQLDVNFAGIYYFDGQGFLVPTDLGVASARELDGARICVQPNTTHARNLMDYATTHGITLEPVEGQTARQTREMYDNGECDALTSDISSLAGLRLGLTNPDAHAILPDAISKEPFGPVVRDGDDVLADATRWVLYSLIAAEEYGVTQANARALLERSQNPEVRRLLGAEGALGESMGLDQQFAYRAIEAVGNYGELFDRHLGETSPLQLRRGLNGLWTQGGLMFAPPLE